MTLRSPAAQQLQTAFRFAQRSFLNACRECTVRRMVATDTSGWYAGWVPHARVGTVAGAVTPAAACVPVAAPASAPPAVMATSARSTAGSGGAGKHTRGSLLPDITASGARRAWGDDNGGAGVPSGGGGSSVSGGGGSGGSGTSLRVSTLARSASSTSGALSATATSRKASRSGAEAGSRSVRSEARGGTRRPLRARFDGDAVPAVAAPTPPASSCADYQHVWTVAHENATNLVRKYFAAEFTDQPVNR